MVLVHAAYNSATLQFARLIRDNRIGSLVGQPTVGNRRGINGRAFFFATPPNSRIEIDLPLIATFPDDGKLPDGTSLPFQGVPAAGIQPDVLVTPNIESIAASVAQELEAAKGLLRSGK